MQAKIFYLARPVKTVIFLPFNGDLGPDIQIEIVLQYTIR